MTSMADAYHGMATRRSIRGAIPRRGGVAAYGASGTIGAANFEDC